MAHRCGRCGGTDARAEFFVPKHPFQRLLSRRGGSTALPASQGTPVRVCPALRPRAVRMPDHYSIRLLTLLQRRQGPGRKTTFRGSITRLPRSLSTLRAVLSDGYAGLVSGGGQPYRMGLITHRAPMKGFYGRAYPPFLGFGWRDVIRCSRDYGTGCKTWIVGSRTLARFPTL